MPAQPLNVGPPSNADDPIPMVNREADGQLDISGPPAETSVVRRRGQMRGHPESSPLDVLDVLLGPFPSSGHEIYRHRMYNSGMAKRRRAIPVNVRALVLHEAGYKCGNPDCRGIITLDLHHVVYVSEGGKDVAGNLLPLCLQCHGLHHIGHISTASIRTWKMLLLALNEAFDRRSIDTLLMLRKMGCIYLKYEGLLAIAALVASEMVECKVTGGNIYETRLAPRGGQFVENWIKGDQEAALSPLSL